MNRYIISIGILLVAICCEAQNKDSINLESKFYEKHYLHQSDYLPKLSSLRKSFSKNKEIPESIELECLTALSFYPELKETKIRFYFDVNLKPMMQSIPCVHSLKRKREKRVYFIKIRTNSNQNKTFNELVGVLGHELAHVLQTVEESSYSTLRLGLAWQFNKKKRENIEKEADRITIRKGLGYALFERRKNAHIGVKSTKQLKYIRKIYLTPEEILIELNNGTDINNG